MRLLRGKVPVVLDQYNYRFEIGKAALLEEGSDVLIIASADDHARTGGGKAVAQG